MQVLSLAINLSKEPMIRYLSTPSTLQPAARPLGRDRHPAAKCDRRASNRSNPQGSFSQIDFLYGPGSTAYGSSNLEVRLEDRHGSNLSDHQIDLSVMDLPIDLPIMDKPALGQLIWGQALGQQLTGQQFDRVWQQRSGRYGCTTVPRED